MSTPFSGSRPTDDSSADAPQAAAAVPAASAPSPPTSAPTSPADEPAGTRGDPDVDTRGDSAVEAALDRARRDPDIDHVAFEAADLNKDGVLDADEVRAYRESLKGGAARIIPDEPVLLPNDPRPHHGDRGPLPWHEFQEGDLPPARYHRWRKVAGRTLSKAWGDSLFGLSSQAAYWSALSTAPILLAFLGFVGVIAPLFGPDTLAAIQTNLQDLLHSIFNQEVADNLVGNTVTTILSQPRGDLISIGLVIALWAGSSSMSAYVEAITVAYRQHEYRNPVLERFFALFLYLIALGSGVVLLPLLAIGPEYLVEIVPDNWQANVETVIEVGYYPFLVISLIVLLTTLYKVAPKLRHPWVRGLPGALLAALVFMIASFGLRLYLSYVYTHGLTYGALATPITFLIFYYLAGLAIILGAQLNNAVLEYFPMKPNALARVARVKTKEAENERRREAKRAAKEAEEAPTPGRTPLPA